MSSNRVGSVFLGDIQRHRNLATTPPSSPPGTATAAAHPPILIANSTSGATIDMSDSEAVSDLVSGSGSEEEEEEDETGSESEEEQQNVTRQQPMLPVAPPTRPIDPILAIELRIRWLEALVLGSKQQQEQNRRRSTGKGSADTALASGDAATLVKMVESLQAKLNEAVQGHEAMKKFVDKYDQHADLLTPSFALSGLLSEAPTYNTLSPEEIDALLIEMESDIRSADRDMREIDELDKKGVLGAGKLPDYEKLDPRLKKVAQGFEEDLRLLTSLEGRVASLMQRHASYIDTLSELFVAWDETLSEAEDKVAGFERERTEKLRLGLEP